MAQSNNSARVAISTNETFYGLAGKIQAPVVTTPQANVTSNTSYTLSGTGVLGSGSYSTIANPTTTHTLSGTGVLGNGTNAPNTTTTTNTNNLNGTGTQGGGAYNPPPPVPSP
jgi:hypothetical protein